MSHSPRLIAVTGPLEGGSFELAGEEPCTIGRHASNRLQLRDAEASRRHCAITPRDGRFVVRDLESRHGTFLNGVPVGERELRNGDFLKVGGSLFLFLDGSTDSGETVSPVRWRDGDVPAESTLELRLDDGPARLSESFVHSLDLGGRARRELRALFALAADAGTSGGGEALAALLVERLADVVPAERTAVLLAEPDGALRLAAAAGIDDPSAFAVSRALVERAMNEGIAVVSDDVVCVPLRAAGPPLGAVVLERRDAAARFDEDHLRLVSTAAGLAAPGFETARRLAWLEAENRRLRGDELDHEMVGESAAMRRVLELIARAAPTDSTVLIRGESGTGKELAARALHRNSPRSERPFVTINCATLSETLLESELFGHERGAFTGAVARKIGKLETADGGTVFLDELGEIPPALQAKLLRAIEEREFERVGGTRPIRVDVRFVAATHRDLEAAVAEGTFREDLYYRLRVIELRLAPLRERREDIPLLAHHFAARFSRRVKRPLSGLSPAARDGLTAYDWPGNIRELANAVERAVVLGQSEELLLEDLPENVLESRAAPDSRERRYHDGVNAAKRRLILEALEATGGHYTRAAERLGLNANYLHRLSRNLDLKAEIERRAPNPRPGDS